MWVAIWYHRDPDWLLHNKSIGKLFSMFSRGLELEKFRAGKIAQYTWGKPDPETNEPANDKPDLATKVKNYGSGRVVTR